MHYVAPSWSTCPSPSPVPSQHTDLDLHALRSLDFFLKSSAIQLEHPFEQGLWSQAMSCLLHSQPAVKHGLIALSAFHENFQDASRSVHADRRKVLALEHYGRSINEIVQLRLEDTQKSLGPTLVACLLFCIIESLQGHFASAMKHIAAGLDLLNQCDGDMAMVSSLPSVLFEALRRSFICLGMQAAVMEDVLVQPVLWRYLQRAHLRTSCCFSTTDQALAEAAHLLVDGMKLMVWTDSSHEDPDFPSAPLQQAIRALQGRFDHWNAILDDLARTNIDLEGVEQRQPGIALLALRINQHVIKIMIAVVLEKEQTAYDMLTDEFDSLMNTAEEIERIESSHASAAGTLDRPMFNVAMGVVSAVFFTCIRCRDRSIRYRALSYLKKTKRRETLWDAAVVASVAEKLVAIEEEAAARYWNAAEAVDPDVSLRNAGGLTHSAKSLPETERIEILHVDFTDSETSAKISFINKNGSSKHQRTIAWGE